MTIRIEFLSTWKGTSNTHHAGPCQGRTSHIWYNSGVVGLTDATSPRATLCQVIGTLTPLGLTPMSPSTSLLPPRCDLPFDSWPKLYYSASRSEWLIWPTKCYTAFNMTQGRIINQSINDSDRHSFAPKTWSVLWLHYRIPTRSQIHL
jgi:hypothetical protein